jgi:hypothetical protein
VITNTDGQENASREWSPGKVRGLISEREGRGNWTFAFFGEGLDAWSDAAQYGFAPGAAMAHSSADIRGVYASNARVSNVMCSRGMRSRRTSRPLRPPSCTTPSSTMTRSSAY